MNRNAQLFLAMPLLVFLAYVIYTYVGGPGPGWNPLLSAVPTKTQVPVSSATPVPFSSVTASATASPTANPRPTDTATPSRTATFTPAPSVTSTRTPTPLSTATPTATSATTPALDPTRAAVEAEIVAGMEQGTEIIEALEAHEDARGGYPEALDALVPEYLAELPLTLMRQPYYYRRFETGELLASEIYWLSFRVMRQEHVVCTYFKRLEAWDCNFESP